MREKAAAVAGAGRAGESPRTAGGLLERFADGYRILEKDDGTDYWSIAKRFLNKEFPAKRLPNLCPDVREVYLADVDGRPLVLKRENGPPRKLEKLAWQLLAGPFNSSLMRRVNRAVNGGCRAVPDMYLAAERMRGPVCVEAIVLMEYLEGRTLLETNFLERRAGLAGAVHPRPVGQDFRLIDYYAKGGLLRLRLDKWMEAAIRETMSSLHSHGLAHCDLHPSNILVGGGEVRIIDLGCRGTLLLSRAKDLARLKARYGIDSSAPGALLGAACRCIALLDKARSGKRRLVNAVKRFFVP